MTRKVHMQDQVFNKVKHIMQHRYRRPIHMHIGRLSIILQFPVAPAGLRQNGEAEKVFNH